MHPLYPYAPAHGGTLLGAAAGHVAFGHAPEPPHQAGGLVASGVPGSCLDGGAMVTHAHSEPKPMRAEIGGRMSHPKGVLMERAQKLGLAKPEFRTEQTGPEHEPRFLSDVVIDGEVLGTGQGGTKRTAEKYAAEEALTALESRSGGKAGAPKKADGKKSTSTTTKKSGAAARSTGRGGGKAVEATAEPPAKASNPVEAADDEPEDAAFDGPWPMFDDLLAAVVTVAERRVTSDLRGETARTAIRDFSLDLYKELLLGLGDILEEDEDDEEEDED